MNTKLSYAAVGGLFLATVASTVVTASTEVPEEASAAVTLLETEGWTIVEVEVEDDEIEIEAEKDGQERELTVEASSGEILSDEIETETED